MPCQRTRKCFASDVIPVRPGFAIGKDSQSVGQANGAEVIDLVIDDGSQTASAVARRSEADQIGPAI